MWIPVKSGTFKVYATATYEDGKVKTSNELTVGISKLTREVDGNNFTYTSWEEEEGDINDKKSITYFKSSVVENAGFYMGRYEMGMPGQKSGDIPVLDIGTENRNIKGTPVCVANVMPWNYIDWDTAKENIESMYNGEVQSAMLNSYARTTMLNWIVDTGAKTVAELQHPIDFGNYSSMNDSLNYSIIGYYYIYSSWGEVQSSGKTTNYTNLISLSDANMWNILVSTGANTQPEKRNQVNNIYDFAGNTAEWSTERLINGSEYRKSGGSFIELSNAYSAIDGNATFYRAGTKGDYSTSSRPILYK